VPTVPPEESTLILIVSSQSYDREEVDMRLELNSQLIAEQVFATGGGHNYVSFPLEIGAGLHRLAVVADDGTSLDVPLDLPNERRWLTVSYWSGDVEGPNFTHELWDTPPGIV
jgi:hypothetical protein